MDEVNNVFSFCSCIVHSVWFLRPSINDSCMRGSSTTSVARDVLHDFGKSMDCKVSRCMATLLVVSCVPLLVGLGWLVGPAALAGPACVRCACCCCLACCCLPGLADLVRYLFLRILCSLRAKVQKAGNKVRYLF